MVHCVKFKIDKLPPSLNTMLRTTWKAREEEQNVWDMLVLAEWLDKNKVIFLKPVRVKYTLFFATKRLRDFDNYLGGTKYTTDALKRTFLLRDDSQWIRKIDVEFMQGNPKTIIEISEIEDSEP